VTNWGSDRVADLLARAGVGLVTYMPGSTLRGLLESLSHLDRPYRVVQCLHESSAVAIAHGYTKTSGRPAAILLHSSVGFLNATMAIYNAALDFAPRLLVVGTAPQREERRRPWIDRIHAGEELEPAAAELVKWTAVASTLEQALAHLAIAAHAAVTSPRGPAAVFVDRDVFETDARLVEVPSLATEVATLSPEVDEVAAALEHAKQPVLLAGRLGLQGWEERIRLAESAGLAVLTDLRLPAAFPTAHPAYAGGLDVQGRPFGDAVAVLRSADVVVALGWEDARGVSGHAGWASRAPRAIFDFRIDGLVVAPAAARAEPFPVPHRIIPADPAAVVNALVGRNEQRPRRNGKPLPAAEPEPRLSLATVAALLREAVADEPATLVKAPVEWQGNWWPVVDARSYLGYDGGGGLGSGPGLLIGAAIGLEPQRLALAVLGDGDVLMGIQALWSAGLSGARSLLVVVDNEGFANEAEHLRQVVRTRHRATDWEEHAFPFRTNPVDVGAVARALGMLVLGPADHVDAARVAIGDALRAVRNGTSALVHLKLARP